MKEGDENSEEFFVKDLYLNYASYNEKICAQQYLIMSNSSAECALYTRDFANKRGTEATPYFLAQKAHEIYNQSHDSVSLEVIKGEDLVTKGLNLLYSVGKGATSLRTSQFFTKNEIHTQKNDKYCWQRPNL